MGNPRPIKGPHRFVVDWGGRYSRGVVHVTRQVRGDLGPNAYHRMALCGGLKATVASPWPVKYPEDPLAVPLDISDVNCVVCRKAYLGRLRQHQEKS